jgi:hypothetical protein
VQRCRDEINAILQDDETKEELECPAGVVGRIIGRGGETIRALQSASQASRLKGGGGSEAAACAAVVLLHGRRPAVCGCLNLSSAWQLVPSQR